MNHPLIKTLLFIFLIIYSPSVFGSDNENDVLSTLSHERTWLKLLYYDEAAQQSDVVADEYFLSEKGRTDPLEELKATIKAYDEPFVGDPNEHAVCRFPARYHWLNKKVGLIGYQPVHPKCDNLRKSTDHTPIDSISLIFVSGYLGNPASSFGHSFLKLNNRNETSNNLFDLSVSYGADVPENENIFAYMYKGLFGKYVAAFKDKYFFSQDLVYSSNEFRDIWEYELNLPDEKISFFQLHLWEILGKKFQYLFLNKNCGYEVSKMAEVILDQEVAESARVWFAPVETFHALAEMNSSGGVIKQRVYHPSEQKKVYKRYQELSAAEKEAAVYLVNNDMEDPAGTYGALNNVEKTNIINFAIAYYNYLLVKERGEKEYERLKKKALMARFSLPPQRESELRFAGTMAPDYNDKPSVLSVNFNTSQKGSDYFSIGFTPYAIRSTGRNNLNGDELAVLETEVGFSFEKPFLREFNLISIKQFDRYSIPLKDEMRFSWQLKVAVENVDMEKGRYDAFVKGGMGKTWTLDDRLLAYAMLNVSAHSYRQQIVVAPEIGMRLDFGKAKVMAAFESGFDAANKRPHQAAKITSNVKIGKDLALFLQYTNREDEPYRITSGVQHFF